MIFTDVVLQTIPRLPLNELKQIKMAVDLYLQLQDQSNRNSIINNESQSALVIRRHDNFEQDFNEKVMNIVKNESTLLAIKFVKDRKGIRLKEAKEYVDALKLQRHLIDHIS